jgi:HEAT repeat protein
MVGIGGDKDALAGLMDVYAAGNSEVREAVIEAYLIADDKDAIFEIAKIANSEEDFEEAVEALGAMDAREELRRLRESVGVSEALIDAYTIADDFDTLLELALDESDPEQQAKAVEALGVVGGDRADEALMEIYRNSDSEQVRESALDGMLISGNDVGVLELYRSSTSSAEKRMLLEYLVHMDSDEVWDIIDATLDGEQ